MARRMRIGRRNLPVTASSPDVDRDERRHFGRWLAVVTVFVGCYVSLLPVSPTGYHDLNCGNAFQAALSQPGGTDGPVPTRGELCHPVGVARLVDVAWIVGIGLMASLVIGHFAQPPKV